MTKEQQEEGESDPDTCSVYQEVLSDQFYADAFQLLGETRELRNEQVEVIQKWFLDNPKINGQNDPRTILFFLRGCKFNVDKAKKKIKW